MITVIVKIALQLSFIQIFCIFFKSLSDIFPPPSIYPASACGVWQQGGLLYYLIPPPSSAA
jgi:hypothetical protein